MWKRKQKSCKRQNCWMIKKITSCSTHTGFDCGKGRYHWNCDSTQRSSQSRQNPGTWKWMWKQSPTPIKRLAAIYVCWEKRKWILSLTECPWVYQPQSRSGPIPRSCCPTQSGLMYLGAFFYFEIFTHFLLCFVFDTGREWEKKLEVGWVGR